MSTQINVTVDRGGLLQRNRQQTTANRQAALDDDAAKQVQQSATEQLEAKQVPDDTSYRSTRIDRKPAANRLLGYIPALGFTSYDFDSQNRIYSITFYSGDGLTSVTKSHRTLLFNHDFQLRWDLPSYGLNYYSPDPMDWGAAGTPPANGMYDSWPYQTMYSDSTGEAVSFRASGNSAYAQGAPEGVEYIYSTIRRAPSTDTNNGILCFPLSKDTFVAYYFFYSYFCQAYSGNKVERRDSIQPIGQVNVGDYYLGGIGTGTIYAAQRTEQLVDSFTDVYQDEERVQFCFLVSRRDIKEIPVPPGLTAAVGNLYPQLVDPVEVPFEEWPNTGELRSTVFSVGTPPELVSGETTVVPLSVTLNDYFAYEDLTSPFDGTLYPEVDIQPLAGYGIGYLNTNNHLSSSDYVFTPGVFSLLDNGQTVREYVVDFSNPPYYDTNYINYDYLYSNFLSDTPFKGIYLDLNQDGFPYFRGKPVVTGPDAQPVDTYTEVPEELFKRNLRESFPLLNGKDPLFVWNWGAPGYCRQRLLELGFTEADLSFDPPP